MENRMKDYTRIIIDYKNTSREERIQAAFHLENSDDEGVKILGKSLFQEPSPIVRHEIAFSLGESAHPKIAGEFLMKAIENDKNIFVIHEALLALATLGDKKFIPFIKKYLNDPRKEISESAEIALERLMS